MIEHVRTITVDLRSDEFENNIQQGTPRRVSCFFPNTRGVVEMIAADGATVLLAASGHIRSFIAQRMNEDGELSSKANLAPITTKIIAYPTGSAFESDWIVLERAREVDKGLYTKLNEQNRRAMLVLDPAGGTWRVEDTLGLDLSENELVVGPILTKKAARAMGEAIDDVFELCRYPKELALAPNGTACAYKEMGRCPGACDGSETMQAYELRLEAASKASSQGIIWWKDQLKIQIAQASAGMDFEQAQFIKRQLDQVEKLPMDTLGLAKQLDGLRCVCVTPSVRKGWAMVWDFNHTGMTPVVSLQEESQSIEAIIARWEQPSDASNTFDQIWLDRFALLSRHWMTKPSKAKRRRVSVLDLRNQQQSSGFENDFHQAIADACVPVDAGLEDEEHTHIKGG